MPSSMRAMRPLRVIPLLGRPRLRHMTIPIRSLRYQSSLAGIPYHEGNVRDGKVKFYDRNLGYQA